MEFYTKGINQRLTADDISSVWYSVIEDFHHVDNFEEMEINRYNWVRHDHFYLNAYDFRYIESFLIALSSSEEISRKSSKFIELLKMGETLSDKSFFEEIKGNTKFDFVVNDAIKKANCFLEESKK